MDLSIVILNYKNKGDVLSCLKSIKEADFTDLKYEIIVVDNNSDDSIGDILAWQYPEIIFIQNDKNVGMGAGNNIGLKRGSGDYLVVMNPDTIVFNDSFKKIFDFIVNNPQVGVVGPMQLNPDKSIQNSCYRWHGLLTPLFRRTSLGKINLAQKDLDRFLMKDFDHKTHRRVDWLLGSFLFCRREALQDVKFFDERYFLYLEDTDLCRSLWKNNWEVVYCPEAVIIHNHRRQSAQNAWYKFFTNQASRNHIVSWGKYLVKWGTKQPKSIG